MKKLSAFLLVVMIILGLIFCFRKDISNYLYEEFILDSIEVSTLEPNSYYKDINYNYVQITDDFVATSYQHIMNIYYTVINSGATEFIFKCDTEYDDCLSDVKTISHDQNILSNINSYVPTYNSFESVETEYNSLGKVVIKINHLYSDSEIDEINNKINTIITNNVKNTTDTKEIIKIIHDYIINNSSYDSNRSDNKIVNYKSDIAYGPLIEGYGLCGGYTDSMALFLDYYDIPNFKVISENHIWNAVYLDGKWYHLDLTWDDPVSNNGKAVLEYTFFLISTDELYETESVQHNFDTTVFSELA